MPYGKKDQMQISSPKLRRIRWFSALFERTEPSVDGDSSNLMNDNNYLDG
jgi:hypothetical protein